LTPRDDAARILVQWETSQAYIEHIFHDWLTGYPGSDRDKRFLQELVYGTVRWKKRLDYIIATQYHGQYGKAEHLVRELLRLGLYQIIHMDSVPAAVAINETVESAKRLDKRQATGLINGVLRSVLRNLDEIEEQIFGLDPIPRISIQTSHPEWLVGRWMERYGEAETEALCQWNNLSPDVTLRVNTTRTSLEEFEKKLQRLEVPYEQSPHLKEFYILRESQSVFQGNSIPPEWYSVQDQAAGLAASCIAPEVGDRILAPCAGPGGKVTFLAQRYQGRTEIIAGDIDQARLGKVRRLAGRLGLENIRYICADAGEYPFPEASRILLDVPCTGTGVLGKRVDARWRRSPEDIRFFVALQEAILKNTAGSLGSGGVLVYSTCTLEPEENWGVIENFLETHPDFSIITLPAWIPDAWIDDRGAFFALPHKHRMDGAFAVRLKRADS